MNYSITSTSINIHIEDGELKLYFDVNAENISDDVDYELLRVNLYHNNVFLTGGREEKDLKGKSFIWNSKQNDKGEEAGYLYVLEHEDVTKGTIEILEYTENKLLVKWSGTANVFWNEDYRNKYVCEGC